MQDQDSPRADERDDRPVAHEPWTDCPLRVEIDHDLRVNFAMQQNDVPVVKRLRLVNEGPAAVEGLQVAIRIAGDLSEEKRLRIDRIGPGAEFLLERLDLDLDPQALATRSEREKTRLEVELVAADRVLRLHRPVEVLAFNEWGGISSLPEIVAAFIQPNHPAIDALLASASAGLRRRGLPANLDAYQSGSPERALMEMRALFETLAAEEIGYVGVPASFEAEGQKVRLPGSILEHRLGNCLDLSLLFASMLEQAGFDPLIVIVKGHAFVGAWTAETSYPEPVIDDAARLRKRVDLGEIVVIEATSLTQGAAASFEAARAEARRRLDDDGDFLIAIDVACARRLKIRPLPARWGPTRTEEESSATRVLELVDLGHDDEDLGVPDPEPEAPAVPAATTASESPARPRRESRIDRWKRRLLDLSLRNRLLNFRLTRKTLELEIPDVAALEDRLAEGGELAILPRPALADDRSPRDLSAISERTREDALRAFLGDELAAGRIHAPHDAEDLDRRLVELHRAARSDLEETGSNTLHLAIGFLAWYETESAVEERRAPLLMLPVELLRRSARSDFRIRLADDEARINVTLLEKLRRDHEIEIEGLDELPHDDTGIDIAAVFRRFRQAIVDMPRWDLVEESALGLFSFTKFLMWQDLENHADSLKESAVVRHLVENPGGSFQPEAAYPEGRGLDEGLPPLESYCPLDADSSQLAAVVAATSGSSFVLQGPPGTGKSQTIANLVAQALARGQRVLFVAEKMAALDVVHSRLARIGLESACLEIHSNKSSKRHVLEQLRIAIEETAEKPPADWERTAADLALRRRELNDYVAAIHDRHAPGLSVFAATSRLIDLADEARVTLEIEDTTAIDEIRWRSLRELAAQLGTAAAEIGDPSVHPLRGLRQGDWTPRLHREIEDALAELAGAATEWREAGLACDTLLGLDATILERMSLGEIRALGGLVAVLLAGVGCERSLLTEPGFAAIADGLRRSLQRGRARDELRAELARRYDDALLDADPGPHREALRRARASFFPLATIRGFLARRALKPHLRGPMPDSDSLIADLDRIAKLREESAALAAPGSDESHFFGRHWRGGRGDWKGLAGILEAAATFRARTEELAALAAPVLRDRSLALATSERDLVCEGGSRRKPLERLAKAVALLDRRLAAFLAITRFAEDAGLGETEAGFLPRVEEILPRLRGGLRDLRAWCHWARLGGEAREEGLAPLVAALGRGRFPPAAAARVFEKSFLEDWLDRRVEASELLLRFNSREHERLIESFQKLDRRHMELCRQELKARLAARAPALDRQVSARSEVGILQRQLKLKRRHLPIRKLFESLPELLPRLKPCLLMSPLSVAQYLGPDFPRADLVVFDEASQIPVWDAIGALARGKAAVVVGDSRQLPPTSFFDRVTDEEPDEELVEELESILDECEAGGLRSLRLLWHYRSRNEGLIAFSNHHYYDGRLQTFPAPAGADGAPGPRLVPVAGVYDRSASATNEIEAQAVVAELARRLEDPTETRSIGVVAFSKAQQDLILDLVDRLRRERPEIDLILAEERDEALFVKNLENVQGDERDLILFSICYGPDAGGKVSMNFGPLNREGGERRLNVAITRARRELVVFSSLRPEQIDLNRSQAVGVGHLKSFLEYAERGPRALGEQATGSGRRVRGRHFENAVAFALEARGLQVDRDLGCSDFRVDVAVRDPRDPERHLLGIIGDGETYRDAATARDRDRIREGVLEGLGWRLMRVWSQDWFQDPVRETERILGRVEALVREEAHEEPAGDEEIAAAAAPAPEAIAPGAGAAETGVETEAAAPPPEPERLRSRAVGPRVEYVETTLRMRQLDIDESRALEAVDAMMLEVVAAEWPVHRDNVIRRVARAAGIDRVTHKVRRVFGERLEALAQAGLVARDEDFLFAASRGPDDVACYRPAPERGSPRDPEHVHPAEIALAAADVVAAQIALPGDELLREISRLLGYSRTSARMLRYLQAGVDLLAERGGCVVEDDNVRLPRAEDAE